MWAQILNTLIGIWLTASPSILNYSDAADSNHIVGPVVATFATVAWWETTRGLRILNIPLGCWLIAAPWILGYNALFSTLNDMVFGALIIVLATIKGKINQSYGGGWKVLWRKQNRPAAKRI